MRVARFQRTVFAILTAAVVYEPGLRANKKPDETALRKITQELLDAIAPGRIEPWAKYLDDSAIQVNENGILRTKAEILEELTPLPVGLVGAIAVDKFRVVFHGDSAVAAVEIQEHLDYFGQVHRSRFRSMDTWRRTSRG